MFTGLIQHVGLVVERQPAGHGARLIVDPRNWDHRPTAGDSIAINGCCLTVAAQNTPDRLEFDVIEQTLRLTSLGDLTPGVRVNLEHAATPSTLMGGHIVQGHVDGVGTVIHVRDDDEYRLRVEPPCELMEFIVDKGSIAVEGVSLTLATVDATWFEVALIPTTLEKTNLGECAVGSRVNLEADCIAKTVVHWLRKRHPAIDSQEY